MPAQFKHYDLKVLNPSFDSSVTDLIIALETLRNRRLTGSTPPFIFFQLKHIFHLLESIGSARIEGNNTTIAEYIETTIEDQEDVNSDIREIQNIEKAMKYIDDNIGQTSINRSFISDIHSLIVNDLPEGGEGDKTPGAYRQYDLSISKSTHKPPQHFQVSAYMDELFDFINQEESQKYDLLRVAIAHHRFVWIHPFGNGNGRTVRLFTYAMLIKLGFNVNVGRILNPTAVFCTDRQQYYDFLSLADSGSEDGLLGWCEYVLKGLKEEIEKIDKLLDYDYLKTEILYPMISYSLDRKIITDSESKVLKVSLELKEIKASDIKHLFPDRANSEISREIKKLIDKKLLMPKKENGRIYTIRFDNNFLLRGIIKTLGDKGFLALNE